MPAPKILSLIAGMLTLIGVNALTLMSSDLNVLHYVSRLNEVNAEHQALANGLFLMIGVFWMGAIDSTRRWMEPTLFDPWLRFSAIAFAASYILSMVFPCDSGCPPFGSLNQNLHSTIVWGLYIGPFVFAVRSLKAVAFNKLETVCAYCLILLFLLLQIDTLLFHIAPGVWQRLYELMFCGLWWRVQQRLLTSA
jgi:hypothetical protein